MPVAIIILNILFVVGVIGAIVGGHLYAIATQHHDHGVEASEAILRRRVWSPRRRQRRVVAGQRPVRPGQVWPAT